MDWKSTIMTQNAQAGTSIYVCHTFYHAYIAALKELNKDPRDQGKATLLLSTMSTRFGDLDSRAKRSGIFRDVVMFEEKDWTFFPELAPLKKDTGSLLSNMKNRIRFCRELGRLEAPYVPVDFRDYDDIYVFCDSDPIGYYLSWKKIPYHAVEDGLDCIRYRDTAVEDNLGHFALKAWMSRMGLIFIQNGYGRYCLDMEVNDISVLDHPMPKMIQKPRSELTDHLSEGDRDRLMTMFIANKEALDQTLDQAAASGLPLVLILTEPLCQDLSDRRRLFEDMVSEYGQIDGRRGQIIIKPHPRDLLHYEEIFPDHLILDASFPMEILNLTGAIFDRVVTVYTVPKGITCAREKIYLGNEFMDRYEDPALHAKVKNAVRTITKEK